MLLEIVHLQNTVQHALAGGMFVVLPGMLAVRQYILAALGRHIRRIEWCVRGIAFPEGCEGSPD